MSATQHVLFGSRTELAGETATVTAHGDLDLRTAPYLWDSIADALGLAPTRLVIDLAGVSFIDSSGTAVIFRACEHMFAPDEIVVRYPSRLAGDVSEFTGLAGRCTLEPLAPPMDAL